MPDARVERVEEVVRKVLAGEIRVPIFQRGFKWDGQQVIDLLDSVYRGLPIGSLLLFTRAAPAAAITLGPLRVDAPKMSGAWWVVDGQQRLVALTVALSRPTPLPDRPQDPFIVFFDPVQEAFHGPARQGQLPATSVELPRLADATALGEWLLDWPNGRDRELRRKVLTASTRIREYRLPLYIVETDDEQVLREIFFRVNNTGKRMEWPEVHDALYGHRGAAPSTVAGLAEELAAIGMGRISDNELTTCLLAFRGLDPTRTIVEHRGRGDDSLDGLDGAAAEALPALQQALVFL